MNVNGINQSQSVNFGQESSPVKEAKRVDLSDPVDTVEFSDKKEIAPVKKKASTAKKISRGVMSGCIPGLGQFKNGDNKKGAIFLGSSIGTSVLSAAGICLFSSFPVAAIAMMAGAGLGQIGICVGSIVDAVKNAK